MNRVSLAEAYLTRNAELEDRVAELEADRREAAVGRAEEAERSQDEWREKAFAALDTLRQANDNADAAERERDFWKAGSFKFDEERRAAEAREADVKALAASALKSAYDAEVVGDELRREVAALREALNLALMHLEDERALAAVRAALVTPEVS